MRSLDNTLVFSKKESHLTILGPSGKLELWVTKAKPVTPGGGCRCRGVGIVCHPHPLQGGTMNNKVVHMISRAFSHHGLDTVRFNFRGVGKSEGAFGHIEGEIEDLLCVLSWVKKQYPGVPLWLAGFSFGAYISAKGAEYCLAEDFDLQQLISVAPAVHTAPYDTLDTLSCPWLIVQGTEDEIVPVERVYQWAEKLKSQSIAPTTLVRMMGASHFFHSKLIELYQHLMDNFFVCFG